MQLDRKDNDENRRTLYAFRGETSVRGCARLHVDLAEAAPCM